MEFTISTNQIIWFCSFVAGLWGLWKIVKEARKPNDDLKAKVEKHDRLLDKDNKRLEEIESSNQMILKSLLVIINHEITGNGVEKMKTVRDSLEEYLIKRYNSKWNKRGHSHVKITPSFIFLLNCI